MLLLCLYQPRCCWTVCICIGRRVFVYVTLFGLWAAILNCCNSFATHITTTTTMLLNHLLWIWFHLVTHTPLHIQVCGYEILAWLLIRSTHIGGLSLKRYCWFEFLCISIYFVFFLLLNNNTFNTSTNNARRCW